MGIAERKEREKEQRRNDIIDAAERIFFKNGAENSTMDDVAREAELSKGTLYLYFRSKEDLQFAISVRGSDILTDMLDQSITFEKSGYGNLIEMAYGFIEFSGKYRDYFQLFLYFQTNNLEELRISGEQVDKYFKEQSPMARVNACVEKGIADGSLRDDIPVNIFASTLWSQMMGVLVVLEHKKEIYKLFNVSEEEIIRTHLELVSSGALKKPNDEPD